MVNSSPSARELLSIVRNYLRGGRMQAVLLKLQADVEGRKYRRPEYAALIRGTVLACALFVTAYQMGARGASVAAEPGEMYAWAPAARAVSGEGDYKQMQIDRLERVYRNSAHYGIPADLAAALEDIALAERINPKLAFELVRTESEFNQRAVSPVGAVGYTQLMPATARLLSPGITRTQLFDRDTNLRLGFRFLRSLLVKYDGNVKLALLAYNRGPERVDQLLRLGIDPSNGYVQMVLGK